MAGYDFAAIEGKWQRYWQEHETFRQPNPGERGFEAKRPRLYVLDMFPYPSGAGLHVGHPEGYTATDIVARFARMCGYNVLHPMGYDAFGLPAQQYAVEHGIHPRVTTERNIANIERQIKSLGFSYDWSRRVATTEEDYYRWTQWIFLKMFNSWYDPEADAARPIEELERKLLAGQFVVDMGGNIVAAEAARRIPELDFYGVRPGQYKFAELEADQQRRLLDEYRLAYIAEVPVNWCPALGTVLANEEVTNEGRSDRGDHPVYRRALKQWMLRITAYAERLLAGLDGLDWPESIKTMQRNWIGRSTGAEVDFFVAGSTGVSPVTPAFKTYCEHPGPVFRSLTSPSFVGKNPYPSGEPLDPTLIARARNLPHLEVPGATYFVTFHAVGNQKLDEGDREIVGEACLHWHGEKCCVYALVVLDDHVHMIVHPFEGESVTTLMHSIKSYSAHEVNKKRGRKGQLWIEESFDHVIRDEQWLTQFVQYLCENPVKRGLASRPDTYPWLWVNGDELQLRDTEDPFGCNGSWRNPGGMEKWFGERRAGGFPTEVGEGEHRRDACGTTEHRRDACGTTEHRRDACGTTEDAIRVYTTRPDTLFGATYMVLAPEHPLVERITTGEQRRAVVEYVAAAARKSELERAAETKDKTGVFTGAYAINPANRQAVPIWVADYVMMGYGTGAIMAVPAHDTRDYDFARKYDLGIVRVVSNTELPEGNAWTHDIDLDWRYSSPGRSPGEGYIGTWMGTPAKPPKGLGDYKAPTPGKERSLQYLFDTRDHLTKFMGEKFPGLNYAPIPACYVADGVAVNSGKYDGLETAEFKARITADLQKAGLGEAAVNYKIRDWIFSRQWYWGEPFPIVHCERCGVVGVPEEQLPVRLPEMEDFTPQASDDPEAPPAPPLGRAKEWAKTVCPRCSEPATRELNAMPQWAGSCWYYLRFLDPKNTKALCDRKVEQYWMAPPAKAARGREDGIPSLQSAGGGVDLYVGGAEHAVLHLLYARFWHKVLYDLGCVSTPEPFARLFNQGMILSFAYRDRRGVYVGYEDVDTSGERPRHKKTGEELSEGIEKMSKSLKNVVTPDEVIGQYGADTIRLYEMFMGPLEGSKPWNTRDVPGVHRFLHRVWRMICGSDDQAALLGEGGEDIERALHRLVRKVGADIPAMKFNTAIAAMMEFVNAVYKGGSVSKGQAERFVLVLAPFAPHIAEELWQRLGHKATLAQEPWPRFDPAMVAESEVELPVQVNGKVRGRITVAADAAEGDVIAAAMAEPKVASAIAGKAIVRRIVVPGKLVNLVVK